MRIVLSLLLSVLTLDPAAEQISAAEQPNIVIIFCDNLGYGDIEPFGSQVHRTPHLNRMASEGQKFTHFYVTSGVCTPSRASLMTGCYPRRVGLHETPRDGQVLRPVSPYGLHPDERIIAEELQALGYTTGMIGKWHLGDQPEFLPTRQGFDEFFGIPYSDDMTQAVGQRLGERFQGHTWPPLPLMRNETVIEAPVDRNGLTKRYTEAAVEFIRRHREKPFFLYLPQAMPGSTAEPFSSPEFRGKSRNGPWGDSIEELDWSTGEILKTLRETGLEQNTLVVWTSDNGAPLAKEITDVSRGSNQPLDGRGYTTAEGAFRVPCLMWWPGTIPAGTVCTELATTMDLLPTCVALAGGAVRADRIDGHDIRPLMLGRPEARSPYEALLYYETDQLQAVRSGPWKLFLPLESFTRHPHFTAGMSSQPLLFNVVEDPGCRRNLAADQPDLVVRLTRLAEAGREKYGDGKKTGTLQRPVGMIQNPTPRLPGGR